MRCACKAIVRINDDNFFIADGKIMVTCKKCDRVHLESDFSEEELENLYWDKPEKKQ